MPTERATATFECPQQHTIDPPRVAVYAWPSSASIQGRPLLALLEHIFPVRFVDTFRSDCLAAVFLAPSTVADRIPAAHLPQFVVRPVIQDTTVLPESINFSGSPPGQPYLRGLRFFIHKKLPFEIVEFAVGDQVVMEADGQAIWVESQTPAGHRATVAGWIPELPSDRPGVLRLIQNRWLQIAPLLDFLLSLTAPYDWDRPSPRACFMFDDPNLHWRSWGFIDYREIAKHATQYDYHVAMAMVPLDTWFTHGPTARIFREHNRRLSLLVHGSHHTHAELIKDIPAARRRTLLADGLRRIERFERRSGITVSRVMAPPHHACSIDACAQMLQTGYEATCVSWDALVRWNTGAVWSHGFGLRPSEFLADGFPVLPRFNFADREDSRVFLAALLRQPIILIGHHWDVTNGFTPLDQIAGLVKRLGPVEWCNMHTVIRSCCLTRRTGRVLNIRMHARRVDVAIPEGVEAVIVDRPWLDDQSREPLHVLDVSACSKSPSTPCTASRIAGPIEVHGPTRLHLDASPPGVSEDYGRSPAFPPVWAYARRFACEFRDRAMPHLRAMPR